MQVDWQLKRVDGFFFSLKIFRLLLVALCTGIEVWLALEARVPEEVFFGAVPDAKVVLSIIKL